MTAQSCPMPAKHLQAMTFPGIGSASHDMSSDSSTNPAQEQSDTSEQHGRAISEHPLKSFSLTNFKAFGPNAQTIPVKPITLIFGANSAGKSSILHFLLWMKDLVAGKGIDIYYPSAGGKSVDLGGFKQMRHGNKAHATVQATFNFVITGNSPSRTKYEIEAISTFATHRHTTSSTSPALISFELRNNGQLVLSAVEEEQGNLIFKTLDTYWLAEFAGKSDGGKRLKNGTLHSKCMRNISD